jgi:hypothetical protein
MCQLKSNANHPSATIGASEFLVCSIMNKNIYLIIYSRGLDGYFGSAIFRQRREGDLLSVKEITKLCKRGDKYPFRI